MAKGITCTCGHSWNKSDSSKKDMNVCHICGKDNTMKDGGWLDKFQPGGNVAVSDATRTKYTKNTGLKKGVDQPVSNMLDITLGAPQRQLVKMVTGKEQSPSEAMGIKNPYGAFATDAILDPTNLVGAGLLGKAVKGEAALNKLISNTGKVISNANKRYSAPAHFNVVRNSMDPSALFKKNTDKFASEIKWGKWNKEIPDNKPLMKEYKAIEQNSKANGTWMKNADGSTFQGTPEQFVQQNSENFKKAFGNTTVVDRSGNPLILHHGSQSGIPNEFIPPKRRSAANIPNTHADMDYTFFHHDKDIAAEYAGNFNPGSQNNYNNVASVYINSKNPLISKNVADPHQYIKDINLNDYDIISSRPLGKNYDFDKLDKVKDYIKIDESEIAVPYGNNVKSAISNNGMFDLNNPNIYKSVAPLIGAGAVASQFIDKKKNGGWLDKYNDGGPIQPNYNDASVSYGPNFVGDGYNTTGRNYSPAWGGQFAMGGSMPGAVGFTYARTINPAPSNGPYAKKTKASAQDGKTIYSGMLPEITVVGSKDPQTEEFYRTILDRLTKEEGLEQGVLQSDPIYNNPAEVDQVFGNPISTDKILGRYEGLMDLGKKYGFPKVNPIDKDSLLSIIAMNIGGDRKSPANYDPFSKTIQADSTKQWVSEMAHHAQMKDNKLNKGIQLIKNDLPALAISEIMLGNRKGPYYTPGAVEHEAHSVIEPKLLEEIKKSESKYRQLPYRKKKTEEFYGAIEDLQNGGEMKYYQEGLDFQPKTISRDGGWLSKYEEGGVIQDDMGQWAHPGEITKIGSNQITMQGVPYPVLGISDTGDTQMMYPNQEYQYEGSSVTEYPMMKEGGALQLTKLDQLTNFTNYNTKQPGGWLSKYE